MDKVKSEHMSSQNSTPNKKTPIKSPTANDMQRGSQQNQQQPKQRRSRSDNHNREFQCGCGKSYLSGAALYTHVKQKHGGVTQNGSQQPSVIATNTKNKSKKNDQAGEKGSIKQEDTQQIDQQVDARTVYDEIINFFAKHIDNNSNQKHEFNEGYDWILEVFPRHYFTKGTDYFKILKNLENLIKQINFCNNQMNNQHHYSHPNGKSSQQGNKSDTQLNGKKQTGEDNFGEENTYENEGDSVQGSPNNLKKIKKKLSGSTVHCAAKNSTATASFDDRHLDAQDNHNNINDNPIEKDNIEDEHHINMIHPEFEDTTMDIFDIQKDIRLTSLNKIFSIFILNISSRVSQPALIEILVFITLFRKALNEKGWDTCPSPLPYEQLRHFMRSPYGYLFPIPGHHHQINGSENMSLINMDNDNLNKKKKNLKKRKQTDNTTTAESSAIQSKKGNTDDDENNDKNCVLQEEDEVEEEIQEDDDENEVDNNESAKKGKKKNLVKVENTSEEKQHHYNSQYEFCEINSGQRVSEICNTFIVECLPDYFKSAISNANELRVIGPSDEGMKNACYVMQLFVNWMYAFKFSESKLVFSDCADDETEMREEEEEEEEIQDKKKEENKNNKKHFEDAESSHDLENELNNNADLSHDHLEGKNSNRFKNNLSGSNRKSNHHNYNSLYDELDDESKENRHTGNQYNNDLEMIGSRKHRKLDMDENNMNNMMMMNGDLNGYLMSGNNYAFNQLQASDHLKMNNVFAGQQVYHGTPNYLRAGSAANSTTYMNNYSNRFYGGDQSTSYYNSNNSTTFYHPPTPAAYSYRNFRNPQYGVDPYNPRSTKFGDHETPKINGYPNGNLSVKSGQIPMMYGGGYFPMSQSYGGYALINPVLYPPMQPVYYQQQVFLSPPNVMAQNSMGDLYNHVGTSSIGQNDFN